MRVLFWSASWLLGLGVLAGLGLHALTGDRIFVGRYVGYVMPWLAVALAPVTLAAWWSRRRALAAVATVPLVVIVAIHAPRFWPQRARAADGEPLAVMSYNTWARNHDAARIARVVREHRPDVLLLQEISPEVFRAVADELRDLYGGAAVHRAYDARLLQAIVSRYPVEPRASLKEKGQAQKAIVHAPAGPIAVFNVHPVRLGGWRHRYDQVAALLGDEVLKEPMPVIVGGDFNSPEHSQLYGMVTRHLGNAHDAAGVGLGFTYPTPAVRLLGAVPAFSVVRIDHIFFSRGFVAVRAGTARDHGGSDHRPVFAELVLP